MSPVLGAERRKTKSGNTKKKKPLYFVNRYYAINTFLSGEREEGIVFHLDNINTDGVNQLTTYTKKKYNITGAQRDDSNIRQFFHIFFFFLEVTVMLNFQLGFRLRVKHRMLVK